MMAKRITYLSGGPRISTNEKAENTAARNHILSVISAFKKRDFQVSKYIVGDILPNEFSGDGSESLTKKNVLTRLAADIVRILFRYYYGQKAWFKYGKETDFVYERFASFQSLGNKFSKRGIPWILESNAILFEESSKESKTLFLSGLAKYFEGLAYRNCDLLVCISDELKSSIINVFGIDSEKILVIPNGVNIEKFEFDKNTNSNFLNIGYVGALVKWQGLDLLLKAISEIDENNKAKIRLNIVGAGPEMEDLKTLASQLKLTEQVVFMGKVAHDNVPKYLSKFDLGYCNPKHESENSTSSFNSPMKLYEYLASGVPVLCADIPEIRNIQGFEEFSYVFKDDISEITKNILLALGQHNSLAIKGKAARGEMTKNHTWEARYELLFDKLKHY